MPDITLTVGESYSLQLDELSSGGYSWDYSLDEGEGIIEISQQSRAAPPVTQPGGPMPDNFEAKREFIIKAIRPGRAVARFFLRRAWEKAKQPLKEQQLNITVVSK
jgi:predicted secreted protein